MFYIVVVFEHALLLIKWIIEVAIKDVPTKVAPGQSCRSKSSRTIRRCTKSDSLLSTLPKPSRPPFTPP